MKRHAKKILEQLMGPTGSVLIHALILLVLVRLVFFEPTEEGPRVEVIILTPEEANLDELRRELRQLEEIDSIEAIAPPEVSLDVSESLTQEVDGFSSVDEPAVDFAALDVVDLVQSPLVMRGLYAGRSDAGRRGALARHAGRWAEETERAVLKALEWLRENQNEDGSWDEENQVAMTGLGLLTFLAHGETPTSERYGETVEKAIRYLVDTQLENGEWPSRPSGLNYVYGHAIAAYAMGEAYGLTEIPVLKDAMERAVRVILDGQQSTGGWDYYWRQTPRRDTSVAGWQIQALKAAQIAGVEIEGLREAMNKAVTDLKRAQHTNGKFGYSGDPTFGTIGVTGVGILSLQLLGHAQDEACLKGIEYLESRDLDVSWDEDAPGDYPLYGWYYITQAKFHHGKNWNDWNSKFARAFTRAQNEDGSWIPPGDEARRGAVYGTTFAALTLQVYYRLLPTYQQRAVQTLEPPPPPEETDLIQVI